MSRVLIIDSQSPVSREIGNMLATALLPFEYAHGQADTLRRLRHRSFGVVITSPESVVEEDLALLEEMRAIRPGVKCIVLASSSTPDEVIAALRARVYACFAPPFEPFEIANLARRAASDNLWRDDIYILSARPGWVSVRVNCRLITADRLLSFAKELSNQISKDTREEMLQALREILLNAMEHGAAFNPEQVVEVTAVRTGQLHGLLCPRPRLRLPPRNPRPRCGRQSRRPYRPHPHPRRGRHAPWRFRPPPRRRHRRRTHL